MIGINRGPVRYYAACVAMKQGETFVAMYIAYALAGHFHLGRRRICPKGTRSPANGAIALRRVNRIVIDGYPD